MRRLSLEELGCAAILAFFAMQGAIPFVAPHEALESSHSAASRLTLYGGIISQLIVYTGIAVLLLRRARRVVCWLGAMQWTAPFTILAIASTAWSQFPLLTLRRSLPFAMAGLFGLYLAIRFPLRRQLSLLWAAMLVLTLASVAIAVCFPKVGLDPSPGHHLDWQGVFTQKNACGRAMVLATAVVLANWRFSALRAASLLVFLFVLLMSGSRSALAIEVLVLLFYACVSIARQIDTRSRITISWLAALLVSLLTWVVWRHLPLLLLLAGRESTLSGRTEIWKQVWRFILQRPNLGWGYAAFWRGVDGQSFNVVAALRFVVFHAHNGFLEIWLELGLLGLVLFGLSYFRAWRKLWPVLRSEDMDRGIWMASILVLILICSLDENTLLTFNGLLWVLYVSTLANIELLGAEDRLAVAIRRLANRSASQWMRGDPEWQR